MQPEVLPTFGPMKTTKPINLQPTETTMKTMTEHMLGNARRDLLAASNNLDIARKCGFPQETPIKQFCQALDRAWELECMTQNSFIVNNPRVILAKTQAREMPNPFAEMAR